MAIEKIGVNVSGLSDIKPPELNLPTSGKDFIQNLPKIANDNSGGYFAYGLFGALTFIFYWILSDKSPFGEFKYTDLRAFCISTSLVSLLGWSMIEVGYLFSLKAVIMISVIFIISNVYLIAIENKQ